MSTSMNDPREIELEPDEWPPTDPSTLSPEALVNDPDDIMATVPEDESELPLEANVADVIDQRTEAGIEDETDGEDAD